MPNWITDFVPLWASLGGGVLLLVGAYLARRYSKRYPAPPTWPEMWARIEALESRLDETEAAQEAERRVVGGILTKLLEQFPQGALPQFEDDELAYMRTTIPGPLFRRLKRAT